MADNKTAKPTLLWDGDCGFCRRWVTRCQRITGDTVDYAPYQQAWQRFPQVSVAQCRQAVQLMMTDGRVFCGAHAVFKALHVAGRWRWLLAAYNRSHWFRRLAECGYRTVARLRAWLPGW